jgi:hypothetical protein
MAMEVKVLTAVKTNLHEGTQLVVVASSRTGVTVVAAVSVVDSPSLMGLQAARTIIRTGEADSVAAAAVTMVAVAVAVIVVAPVPQDFMAVAVAALFLALMSLYNPVN